MFRCNFIEGEVVMCVCVLCCSRGISRLSVCVVGLLVC